MQHKKAEKSKEFSGRKIGQRVREIRESLGLTQRALAEASGLTPQAITQIETEKRQPSGITLIALSQGLDISLDSLVGLPTSKYPHDILKDADVMALAEKIARMPPELREEVKDFVDFLWANKIRKRKRKK